jgi:hypothetical protein
MHLLRHFPSSIGAISGRGQVRTRDVQFREGQVELCGISDRDTAIGAI